VTRHRRLIALALAGGALLIAPAAPAGAAAADVVVPKGGTVAGRTYAQWLGAWWQLRLNRPPDVVICREVGDVAVLIGGRSALSGGESDACTVPLGQPVYLNGLAVGCSTMQTGALHGDTDAQLRSCARRQFRGARGLRATLDGEVIAGYGGLVAASPVVAVAMPRVNVLKTRKRSGRVAAYGVGLLLQGLTAGTHTVRQSGTLSDGRTLRLTYKLRVAPPV
jgi:hypothetical protein